MRTFLFLLVSLLAALVPSATATVLAIDYGSDWIKASLMKPGVPFDVLLNKDSKRKIQSSVGWKKDDRLFGQDAANLASRFPEDSFSSTKLLLAAPYDSPAVSYYKSISSNEVVRTERGTAALQRSDGTEWTPEELIGMEFAYVKGLAETMAGEKVQDVVVTVPPHFTQFERDAIVDAIEISGLRTLALINDGAAVAVNYAMTRNFPEEEYHIIYDAGASSIRATVVSFLTNDAGQTAIQVHGVGYDRSVGGTELDRRLREILADDFNAKHKRDIRKDKRGMAKLWKEAGRVKAILSANNDAISTIESVAWDIDFKTKVSRKAFEAVSSDLQSKFSQPIFKALLNAGASMDQISSVIFTGGATRTPMIQTAVKKAVGESKISLNVNADEAAVLGAALYGASLSRQFRTKDIKLTDINTHDMQVSYFAAATSPNAKPRTITTSIFPAGSKTGSKKTLTLKRKEDFRLNLDYKRESVPGFPTRILEVELSDVKEAIANLTEAGAVDPIVKATLKLSDSGFVSVSEAVAYGEVKSIAGKIKGLFSGSEDQTVVDAEADAESEKKEPVDGEKEEEKEPVPNTIPLKLKTHFTTIPPMTVEQKKSARSRLRAIDADENAKNRREEARNTLEGYIYKLRDLLEDDAGTAPFTICSQDSERKAIARQLEETMEWMHEKADIAETSQFLDRRVALETLERPITHRYVEREAFPQALNNSQMWNWSTRLFLTDARQNLTEEAEQGLNSKWTKEELDALEKTLKEHESWLNTWVEKQKSVKQNEDPAIETTEMRARAKVLEQHLQKLYKRPAPKRSKKKKETVKKEEEKVEETASTQPEEAKETPHDEL